MSANGPILPEDILFQDADVCILKPNVKKGILVFSQYEQPVGMPSLCEAGLKTGAQLQREGVNFGRSMIHDYIFFRAPYVSNPIDYTSIDTEIISSFGETAVSMPSAAWIRIDPEKTYVYSSEIRAKYSPQFRVGSLNYLSDMESEVRKSRKRMTDYLKTIYENATIADEPGKKAVYHLFSSLKMVVPQMFRPSYPWNSEHIHTHSEVLVRLPHLTPNYFVKCT